MVRHFTPETGMVAGYLEFEPVRGIHPLWFKLQSFDLIAMLSCAAGSIRMGWILASSGSNQAYRKEAFAQADGFGGAKGLISGDDDLLMQHLAANTRWKAAFASGKEVTVLTEPTKNLSQFYQQRKRWGAKYFHHRRSYMIFLTILYAFDLLLIAAVPLLFFFPAIWQPLLLSILLKWLGEFTILARGCAVFERTDLLVYFPLWAILHIPYIVFFGPVSLLRKVSWKGQPVAVRGKIVGEAGPE
jgi:cellulose synthase/poly-beta-1,6-N-acetylglucosamine synthase-like glycosyltransferase